MTAKTERLRELLDGDEQFVAASSVTVLAARIAEGVGFPAIYVGGHALGALHYGIPDYGILEQHEIIAQTSRIANSVALPTIVDADELGGNVASIHRAIRDFELAGVAGLHLEDEEEPKHSTHRAPLLSIEEMQARIAAAVASRTDPNFVIIARCNELINRETYGQGSLEEAIRRGQAYAEAGVDAFVAPSVEADEIPAMAKAVPVPLAAFGLNGPGIQLVLTGFGAFDKDYEHWATVLLQTGQLPPEAFQSTSHPEWLTGEPAYADIVTAWAERTGRPTGETLATANAAKRP
jgi:2-methylisocitrate lyase-like PEP mutase family enzyme